MASYDTKEVTKEIADWLNLEENKRLFRLKELSRRIGLDKEVLGRITLGIRLSIAPNFVDKAIELLSPFGFESKYYKKDFDYILDKTSVYFNVKVEDIKSKSRTGNLPKIRKYLMKIGSDKLSLTQEVIAENLGGFNRTSIAAGIITLNGWIDRNRTIRNEYNSLLNKMNISK
jgi:chromosomal replication initiation ATPase DnaA